jgi:hypothetical protein
MESTLQKPAFVAAKTTPKLPHVRFFAGFTSSLAFRYSVTFIARLTKFQTTPPPLGLSSFLCLFFRDCGCGKAMSFDDFFRRDGPSKTLRQ